MFARRTPALLVPVAITLVLFALDRTMAAAGARPDGAQWVALGVMVGGVALLRPHWLGRGPLSVLVALAVAGGGLYVGLFTDERLGRPVRGRSLPAARFSDARKGRERGGAADLHGQPHPSASPLESGRVRSGGGAA